MDAARSPREKEVAKERHAIHRKKVTGGSFRQPTSPVTVRHFTSSNSVGAGQALTGRSGSPSMDRRRPGVGIPTVRSSPSLAERGNRLAQTDGSVMDAVLLAGVLPQGADTAALHKSTEDPIGGGLDLSSSSGNNSPLVGFSKRSDKEGKTLSEPCTPSGWGKATPTNSTASSNRGLLSRNRNTGSFKMTRPEAQASKCAVSAMRDAPEQRVPRIRSQTTLGIGRSEPNVARNRISFIQMSDKTMSPQNRRRSVLSVSMSRIQPPCSPSTKRMSAVDCVNSLLRHTDESKLAVDSIDSRWMDEFLAAGGVQACIDLMSLMGTQELDTIFFGTFLPAALTFMAMVINTNPTEMLEVLQFGLAPLLRLIPQLDPLSVLQLPLCASLLTLIQNMLDVAEDAESQSFIADYEKLESPGDVINVLLRCLGRKSKCLTPAFCILNWLVSTEADLEQRYLLQNRMVAAQVFPSIDQEKENERTAIEKELFDLQFMDDSEDFHATKGNTLHPILTLPTPSSHFFIVSCFNLSERTIQCPYDPETSTTGDVSSSFFSLLKTIVPLNDTLSQIAGLSLKPASREKERRWLSQKKLVKDFGLSGEVHLEFKLLPWDVSVQIDQSEYVREERVTLDPSLSVFDCVVAVMKAANVPNGEYGFKYERDGKLFWLLEREQLFTYKQALGVNQDLEATLKLSVKPLPISVTFQDRRIPVVLLEDNPTLGDISAEVASILDMPFDVAEDYGLLVDTCKETTEKTTLKDVEYVPEMTLRFAPRPHPFTIILPSGTKKGFNFLYNQTVSEVLAKVGASTGFDAKLYCLHKENSLSPLSETKRLRDYAITANENLIVVKRDTNSDQTQVKNVNIWEESEDCIVWNKEGSPGDERQEIQAASLNKLVEMLTSASKHDYEYTKTFLLTYRSFTNPEMLFTKLKERYRVPEGHDAKQKEVVQMRVLIIMKHWVDGFNDSSEMLILRPMVEFMETEVKADKSQVLEKVVTQLLKAINSKKSTVKPPFNFPEDPPAPRLKARKQHGHPLLDLDEVEVARQLSLLDFAVFQEIMPAEFFNQAWSKESMHHHCPNLLRLIARFNFLSQCVPSVIVEEKSLKIRTKLWEKFIRIAHALQELNNFHSLMGVVAGLNNAAVTRLKWTQAKLQKQKRITQIMTDIETLTNMEGSYKLYREHVNHCLLPCMPYVGVFLMDLTFVEDGNPDYIGDLINFSKRKLVHNALSKIDYFQSQPYNFKPVLEIQDVISSFASYDNKQLYDMSLACEPRGCSRSDVKD